LGKNRALNPDPPVFGVVTRMPKRQRSRLHARTTVKLDSVMGVAREMGRLIRLSYNGHLAVSELTGYVYALDKTRACLESAIALEAAAAATAAAQAQADAKATPMTITIMTIPEGYYHQPDGSFAPLSPDKQLQLEHMPAPEEKLQLDEPDPALQPSEEEVIDNLKREINELARKVGVSLVV
jgi:hypothetical protein